MDTQLDTPWGKNPHQLLSLEMAWKQIASSVTPLEAQVVHLNEAAGRVLAGPVVTSADYPPFNKAMMDGFAVQSSDCTRSGMQLDVVGLVSAGETTSQSIDRGQAFRINTGAPIPIGADAVVRIEDTTISAERNRVTLEVPIQQGQNVSHQGHIRKCGDIVLTPPLRLGPAALAAAATAGAAELRVAPRITAALSMTGDEIVPVGSSLKPGQIYESNGPMLSALLRQFDAVPHELGIVHDNPADLKRAFAKALCHPLVITVGGMSMGTHDFVPQVFAELGVRWLFHGVRVKPGKPVAYGRGPDGQHIFGLPGNPVSVFVCAWLFVRMVIRGLEGFQPSPPYRWRATITKDLPPSRDARPAFIPARVWNSESHGMMAEPCRWQGSSDPFGLAMANALLIRAALGAAVTAGSKVDVFLIADDD